MIDFRYQKQLNRHDPENGKWGDCFPTVLACLMNIDRKEVPHFFDQGNEDYSVVYDWMAERRVRLIKVIFEGDRDTVIESVSYLNPGVRWILSGKSSIGAQHVVICKDGKIEHDPSQINSGIVGPGDDGFFWVEFLVPLMDHEDES